MEYSPIKSLDDTGLVQTLCTAVGHGIWFSNCEEGAENYREIGAQLGITPHEMVGTFQRHTSNVEAVTKAQGGEYVIYRSDPIVPRDGIVTNERGLLLTSIESDCTPLFILDPVRRAIGMVHSGWKGTAAMIGARAIQLMQEKYGTEPGDVLVAFGPHICANCYEVGEDLIPPFRENFSESEIESFFRPKTNGKYTLNLSEAISISLVRAGVREENIFPTKDCTFHGGRYYSHRVQVRDNLNLQDNMLTGIMLI